VQGVEAWAAGVVESFVEKPTGDRLEMLAHASKHATPEFPFEASMGIYVFKCAHARIFPAAGPGPMLCVLPRWTVHLCERLGWRPGARRRAGGSVRPSVSCVELRRLPRWGA